MSFDPMTLLCYLYFVTSQTCCKCYRMFPQRYNVQNSAKTMMSVIVTARQVLAHKFAVCPRCVAALCFAELTIPSVKGHLSLPLSLPSPPCSSPLAQLSLSPSTVIIYTCPSENVTLPL